MELAPILIRQNRESAIFVNKNRDIRDEERRGEKPAAFVV